LQDTTNTAKCQAVTSPSPPYHWQPHHQLATCNRTNLQLDPAHPIAAADYLAVVLPSTEKQTARIG